MERHESHKGLPLFDVIAPATSGKETGDISTLVQFDLMCSPERLQPFSRKFEPVEVSPHSAPVKARLFAGYFP